MKCRFSATLHVISLTGVTAFFYITVNLGKRYFCKRGRRDLHFELRASDCAN